MARPRTPTAIQELKGAFKKDPQRRRDQEPEHNGPLGAPPPGFDDELTAIWYELDGMVAARVLAKSDRWLVELACRTMRDVRKGQALASERNLLLSCLSRMGLTPADRSKIAVPQKKEELDELAALAFESNVGAGLRPN
jgi:hypothetical protein